MQNTTRRLKEFTPADWQRDAANLTTPRVQVWTKSGTMAGVISSETAVQHVNNGTHFVMCGQAIGTI